MRSPPSPDSTRTRLAENLEAVRERIASAAARAGRDPAGATLVAVTKTVPPEVVRLLPGLGVPDVGENRVQAAAAKVPESGADLRWHMIGPLQRNKARRALGLFSLFHALDSRKLLRHLDRVADEEGETVRGLLQVNISGETQKHGFARDLLPTVLDEATNLARIRIMGLMGMGPWTAEPEEVRPLFRGLRETLEEVNRAGWYREPLTELSMGMSNDFEVAVEEGATLVRVGTAIFEGVAAADRQVRKAN